MFKVARAESVRSVNVRLPDVDVLLSVSVASELSVQVLPMTRLPSDVSVTTTAVGPVEPAKVIFAPPVDALESVMFSVPTTVSATVAVVAPVLLPVIFNVVKFAEVTVPAVNVPVPVLLRVADVSAAAVKAVVVVPPAPVLLMVKVVNEPSVTVPPRVSRADELLLTTKEVAAVVKFPPSVEATTDVPELVTV
jgi:hypothetical protein